jgi:hypothetical protein
MTLHKLTPEHALPESRQLNLGMTFRHRTYDFADAIVSARAAQALEAAVTTYPIHRLVRFAARGKLEQVLDDLALTMGLAAHRLRHGSLFLDGPGVFVHVHGGQQSNYCSLTVTLWAASVARVAEVRDRLLDIVGERRIRDEMFVLDWYFASGNSLSSTSVEEVAGDVVHDEAYPDLGEPVAGFITRYLSVPETVLLLLGTPGSGKTRLVRAILREISRRKGESAEVMYTADTRALESDEIFVEFITRTHDAFVIEDADHLLKPRADGNHNLHRFLAIADGVVRAQGRKILFTTNLPNIGDVDEALLRPGRCFGTVRTRALAYPEAAKLVGRLSAGAEERTESILDTLFAGGCKTVSVASVYRACA